MVGYTDIAALDFTISNIAIGVGAASADSQGMFSGRGSDPTFNTSRAQDEGFLVLNQQGFGAPNVYSSLAHKSMDADGFTVTRDVKNFVPGFSGYLALSGIRVAVGAETQPTSVSEKATTGLSFTPIALMPFGFNNVAKAILPNPTSPYVDGSHWFIGASDGIAEGMSSHHNARNSIFSRDYFSVTKVIVMADADPPAASLSEADLKSFEAGGYTLDWTKADAVAREFVYLALGEVISPVLEIDLRLDSPPLTNIAHSGKFLTGLRSGRMGIGIETKEAA